MTSPSIKEALELAIKFIESHMHYSQPAPDMGEEPSDMFTNEALPVVVGLNIALATLQPDGERREAIARIKDALNAATVSCSGTEITIQCNDHDVKDAIFDGLEALAASGLVQDEAGIRADEREKCAKIADREAEFWQDAESSSARIVAANIRSARDGGGS